MRTAMALLLWLMGAVAFEPVAAAFPWWGSRDKSTVQCRCRDDLWLDCSSLELNKMTEDYNTCDGLVDKLDVSNNSFDSLDDLEQWSESELNVSYNFVKTIRSDVLNKNVVVVDVSHNNLTTLDMLDLHALRVMNASYNSLTRVEHFPFNCSLEVFEISANHLLGIPAVFVNCSELRVLNVANNTIKTLPSGVFDEVFAEDDMGAKELLVDLRGNPLSANDTMLRALLDATNVTISALDCTCANLTNGRVVLTLCVSSMCSNGTLYWTKANGTSFTTNVSSVVSATDVVPEAGCDGDCREIEDVFTTSRPVIFTTEFIVETSTTVIPTTTVITTNTVPTDSTEVDKLTTTSPKTFHRPGGRGRAIARPEITLPPGLLEPDPEPESTQAPNPGREGRRKRRVYVTLGLTIVVLGAVGVGVWALFLIYRRRQRQLVEEQAQRIPLQPLIDTPRSLRARDDDFVP